MGQKSWQIQKTEFINISSVSLNKFKQYQAHNVHMKQEKYILKCDPSRRDTFTKKKKHLKRFDTSASI